MPSTTVLGEYLRARRALVRPQDVGLADRGRRRVPGLRREELATLAGISADYYLRLEQGRDHNPSSLVIDALARALRLDEDATAHLHAISRRAVPRHPPNKPERAPGSIRELIGCWPNTPALVLSRYLDVLASNSIAVALTSVFAPGSNLVRATFLDPEVRSLVTDWEAVCRQAVARLRALAGPDVADRRVTDIVDELSVRSEHFAQLWARHDIALSHFPLQRFNHAVVGPIDLLTDWLTISGSEGQTLVVYHAEPDTASELALRRLARRDCPSQS